MGSQDLSILDGLDTNAAELRAALATFQPGVLLPGDFAVTPRGAGANRSIDLAGGRAVIGSPVGTMPTFMGPNYLVGETGVINSDAFELGGFAPPHSTYSRLDQVILRLYDNEGGLKKWRPEILQGQVPTTNSTLDLRQSASNLPAGVPVLRLYDVIVPTTGIITATEIRDRRGWARGYMEWDLAAVTSHLVTGLDGSVDRSYTISMVGQFDNAADGLWAYLRPNGNLDPAVAHIVGSYDNLNAYNSHTARLSGNIGMSLVRTYGAVVQHVINAQGTLTARPVGTGAKTRTYLGSFTTRRADASNPDFLGGLIHGYMENTQTIWNLLFQMGAPMTFTGRLRVDRH